jgi:cell division transport system permease protein
LILAGFMLSAAILLISNTIRVAAFSRRRETGIMRLVGASNFYIQLPFLLEGAIAGLFGGVLASGFVALGKWFLVDLRLRQYIKFTTFIGWNDVISTVPIILITAVLISVVASYLTLLRYLRV